MKKQEKLLKELEKLLDNEKKKNKKNEDNLAKQGLELKDANKVYFLSTFTSIHQFIDYRTSNSFVISIRRISSLKTSRSPI